MPCTGDTMLHWIYKWHGEAEIAEGVVGYFSILRHQNAKKTGYLFIFFE
jgi:hypothetical protein